MVTGPRQCGKTTLVRDLVGGKREFITMDDDTVLAAARSDPTGLVRALDRKIETPLTKYSECPTFSGPSRSQSMMIAGPAVYKQASSQNHGSYSQSFIRAVEDGQLHGSNLQKTVQFFFSQAYCH